MIIGTSLFLQVIKFSSDYSMENINQNPPTQPNLSETALYMLGLSEVKAHALQQEIIMLLNSKFSFNDFKKILNTKHYILGHLQPVLGEIGQNRVYKVIKKLSQGINTICNHLLETLEKQKVAEQQPVKEKQSQKLVEETEESNTKQEMESYKIIQKSKVKKLGGIHIYNESYKRTIEKQTLAKQQGSKSKQAEKQEINEHNFKMKLFEKMKLQLKEVEQQIYNPLPDEISSFLVFERKFLQSFNHCSYAEDIQGIANYLDDSNTNAKEFVNKNSGATEEISKIKMEMENLMNEAKNNYKERNKNIQEKFEGIINKFMKNRLQLFKKTSQKFNEYKKLWKQKQAKKVQVGVQTVVKQFSQIKSYEKKIADLENKLNNREQSIQQSYKMLLTKASNEIQALQSQLTQSKILHKNLNEESKEMKRQLTQIIQRVYTRNNKDNTVNEAVNKQIIPKYHKTAFETFPHYQTNDSSRELEINDQSKKQFKKTSVLGNNNLEKIFNILNGSEDFSQQMSKFNENQKTPILKHKLSERSDFQQSSDKPVMKKKVTLQSSFSPLDDDGIDDIIEDEKPKIKKPLSTQKSIKSLRINKESKQNREKTEHQIISISNIKEIQPQGAGQQKKSMNNGVSGGIRSSKNIKINQNGNSIVQEVFTKSGKLILMDLQMDGNINRNSLEGNTEKILKNAEEKQENSKGDGKFKSIKSFRNLKYGNKKINSINHKNDSTKRSNNSTHKITVLNSMRKLNTLPSMDRDQSIQKELIGLEDGKSHQLEFTRAFSICLSQGQYKYFPQEKIRRKPNESEHTEGSKRAKEIKNKSVSVHQQIGRRRMSDEQQLLILSRKFFSQHLHLLNQQDRNLFLKDKRSVTDLSTDEKELQFLSEEDQQSLAEFILRIKGLMKPEKEEKIKIQNHKELIKRILAEGLRNRSQSIRALKILQQSFQPIVGLDNKSNIFQPKKRASENEKLKKIHKKKQNFHQDIRRIKKRENCQPNQQNILPHINVKSIL